MDNDCCRVITNRRSVRDFTEQPVEEEKLQKIYDAILAAPTTESMMMYTVIRVEDPEIRAKLSKQGPVRKAPVVLVFCADYRRWMKLFDGVTSGRRPGIGEYQLALVDAVLAAENAVLAAEALGLSSVYLGDIMEHYEDRAEALGLPDGVAPVVTLCIGYAAPAQLSRPAVKRYPKEVLIHTDRYHDYSREELVAIAGERAGYADAEQTNAWLTRFGKRCVDGKGAAERSRSIQAILDAWAGR